MKKKLFSLAAVLILSCMLLAGCQSKMVPADQVTGALFELVAMDDASAIQELLGFESEEDVRSSLMEDSSDLVSGLEEMFTGAGITFTQDELDEMKGSLLTMLRKMPYTAEITSEDSDQTVVTLTINGFSMAEMSEIAVNVQQDVVASLSEEEQMLIASGDEQAVSDFMRQYMKDYMTAVGEMEPMEETTEVTVTCEKFRVDVSGEEKVVWMPADVDQFSADVEAAVLQ